MIEVQCDWLVPTGLFTADIAQVLLITLTMVPFYASESACPLQDPENEADK